MGTKSMAVLQILQVLRKYSNKEHALTQKQIADYLESDYGIVIERKAVARHLANLTAVYPIEHTTKGVYLEDEREFDDTELRFLIDSVLFSRNIPASYAKKLVEKLQKLGSVDLRRSLRSMYRADQIRRDDFKGLFYTIGELGAAIAQGKRVRFEYMEYRLDKQLHPVYDAPVELFPYQLVAANGHYYVVGKKAGTDSVESFRIERIANVALSEEGEEGARREAFDLDGYIAEHPYLYAGEKADVKLKMRSGLAGELIDAFGKQFTVLQEQDDTAVISLQAGLADMLDWAKRFAEDVEILEPQSLRDRLRKISFPTADKYSRQEEDRYIRTLEYIKGEERACREGRRLFAFENIDLSRRTGYEELTFCSNILLHGNNLADMSFLSAFPKIVKADIKRNPVSDLSILKGRKELRELILWDTEVTDLSFLEGAEELQYFCFRGKKIDDVSPIYGLRRLRKLVIDCANVKQLDLVRLKRSCPNLHIELQEVSKDSPLRVISRYFATEELGIFFTLMQRFFPDEHAPAVTLSEEDIARALAYVQGHAHFYPMKLKNDLCVDEVKAAAILKWLADAEYIVMEHGAVIRRYRRA